MIWSAPELWPGETAFILAGGPSLRGFDASILKGHGRVLCVNDAWRLAPWCDCLYFTDHSWFVDQLKQRPVDFGGFLSERLAVSGAPDDPFRTHPQVKQLRFTGQMGLEDSPTGLRHGSNSTYAAMNLAAHFGVKRIVLLGLDMQVAGGRTHWHDQERPADFAGILKYSMLPLFPFLAEPLKARGVEVVNCTPGSALKVWPYRPLAEILQEGEQNGN